MFNLLDLSFALHCYVWTSYRHQFDWIITEHIEHTVAVCYARLYCTLETDVFDATVVCRLFVCFTVKTWTW